ncbi:MAG: gliding motility lipoprotein GldD [Bacteroidales bacterium]
MQKFVLFSIFIISSFILTSCNGEDYSPKPRAFFRIDLPAKSYQTFDTLYPYSFDFPRYASIQRSKGKAEDKYWMNINFPAFNATIHITYIPLKNNLDSLIESARRFVDKHISKATSIKEKAYENPEKNIYGMVYNIKGNSVASPYQFFVTDKKKHYIRGALYFNMAPSNDSLAPVIEFIEKDIDYMISTLKWKK